MELKATTLDKISRSPGIEKEVAGKVLVGLVPESIRPRRSFSKTFRVREVFEPQKEWQESLENGLECGSGGGKRLERNQ